MLEAAELRVGNVIELQLTPGGKWYAIRISGIKLVKGTAFISWTDHVGEFMVLNDHFRPILLTPEQLENCGFETIHKNLNWIIRYTCTYDERPGAIDIWNLADQGKNQIVLVANSVRLEYLHQIQNLFFVLSGEELNVPLL